MDIKTAIDKTAEQAKALTKKLDRTIKIYIVMAILFLVSFLLNLYKAHQADLAYDQAQKSLIKYEEGVNQVNELIELMRERNRILAYQDSLNNALYKQFAEQNNTDNGISHRLSSQKGHPQ